MFPMEYKYDDYDENENCELDFESWDLIKSPELVNELCIVPSDIYIINKEINRKSLVIRIGMKSKNKQYMFFVF